MKIVMTYAAILGLLFVFLSVRTLLVRRRLKISLGDSGNSELLRAIRVHANFAEYTPFALLLIFMVEDSQASNLIIHFLGMCLLLGRFLHSHGVSKSNEKFSFRVSGMALSFTSILGSCLYLLIRSIL